MKNNVLLSDILELPSGLAAPLLLGWKLVRKTPQGIIGLRVVETEAYHQDDPASHSYRGQTLRTAPMFQFGGTIYVYFTYGMHYCLNIVTGPVGKGEAVLFRAAEPVEGIELIQNNRGGQKNLHQLTNGPAKLAQALGIFNTSLSGKTLGEDTLQLMPPAKTIKPSDITTTTRVGIQKAIEAQLRFYIKTTRLCLGYKPASSFDRSTILSKLSTCVASSKYRTS